MEIGSRQQQEKAYQLRLVETDIEDGTRNGALHEVRLVIGFVNQAVNDR
jgi:hypothetical protein